MKQSTSSSGFTDNEYDDVYTWCTLINQIVPMTVAIVRLSPCHVYYSVVLFYQFLHWSSTPTLNKTWVDEKYEECTIHALGFSVKSRRAKTGEPTGGTLANQFMGLTPPRK